MEALPQQDFWLTRDCANGELSDELEVWLHRPEPLWFDDGDVTWIAPLAIVDRAATYVGTVTIAEARAELGNGVPTTARECLHVERTRHAAV